MNNIKSMLTIAALATVLFATQSCNNKKNNLHQNDETHHSDMSDGAMYGKEYTSDFVCPMHCEGSGSNTMGNCPVCGMEYVKNHSYACPMHPEVTGIKGDKCTKCSMDLTPISGDDHEGHNH